MMPDLDAVCAIARQAGDAIMAIYADDSVWDVRKKADASPLTAADLAAHELILDALTRLTPDIPVMSEESLAHEIAQRRQWRRCWVVDPLDGTKEFLKRNGEFSVNIALVEGQHAVLGVVYLPVLQLTYMAARGQGAYKRDAQKTTSIRAHRLGSESIGVTVVASRHHRGTNESLLFENIDKEFGGYTLINYGSAYKTCLVAEGRADCYPRFGPTMEWDTAAAQIVLEEAGGQLLSFRGQPFLYNCRDTLTNRGFMAVGDVAERWLACWPEGQC